MEPIILLDHSIIQSTWEEDDSSIHVQLILSCPPQHLSLLPRPPCCFPLPWEVAAAPGTCPKITQVAVAAQRRNIVGIRPTAVGVDIGLLAFEQVLVHSGLDIDLLAFEQALVHSGLDIDLLAFEQALVQWFGHQPAHAHLWASPPRTGWSGKR